MKYRGSELFVSKREEILEVLTKPEVDLWKLRELALSEGGLVNGEYSGVSELRHFLSFHHE